MIDKPSAEVAKYRVVTGPMGSDASYGNNGMFKIPFKGHMLTVIVSDGAGWDHVSVSLKGRCPTWAEMCFVKELFFKAEETVVQFHPRKSEYINNHPYTLHLWRPHAYDYSLPMQLLV